MATGRCAAGWMDYRPTLDEDEDEDYDDNDDDADNNDVDRKAFWFSHLLHRFNVDSIGKRRLYQSRPSKLHRGCHCFDSNGADRNKSSLSESLSPDSSQ